MESPIDLDRVTQTLLSAGVDQSVLSIEALSTLPHSAVAKVNLEGDTSLIYKCAGGAEFAAGTRKELIINRDVLPKFNQKVAPDLLHSDSETDIPWMVFEDLSKSHRTLSGNPPPDLEDILKFVACLARMHVQSRALNLPQLFANVEGSVYVTDGSEHSEAVLDEFLQSTPKGRFPKRTFDLIEKMKRKVPEIVQMMSGGQNLVHGDAHYGNALFNKDHALLIDWAMPVIGHGEVDLCHALAFNLPRYFSAGYEALAIRHYVETSDACGEVLSEAEVLERYRQCLLLTVGIAVGIRHVAGLPEAVWTQLFTNSVHAALDHDVARYLG